MEIMQFAGNEWPSLLVPVAKPYYYIYAVKRGSIFGKGSNGSNGSNNMVIRKFLLPSQSIFESMKGKQSLFPEKKYRSSTGYMNPFNSRKSIFHWTELGWQSRDFAWIHSSYFRSNGIVESILKIRGKMWFFVLASRLNIFSLQLNEFNNNGNVREYTLTSKSNLEKETSAFYEFAWILKA